MKIPGGRSKKTGKFQGVVRIWMEFQGGGRKNAGKILVGVESFDVIPGGTVSENGYPRQGVRTITGKAH